MNKVLTDCSLSFKEYHCFDADVEVKKVILNQNSNDFFVISVRDPIDRYISAFNWEIFEKVQGEKPLHKKWEELFDSFANANEMAEALSGSPAERELSNYGFTESHLHFHLGIAWHLPIECVCQLPKERTIVIKTETFNTDIRRMLKMLGKTSVELDTVKNKDSKQFLSQLNVKDPKYLSNKAKENLKKVLKSDYDVLNKLKENGFIEDNFYNIHTDSGIKDTLWGNDLEVLDLINDFFRKGYCIIRRGVEEKICDQAVDDYDAWCVLRMDELKSKRPDKRNPRVINLHSELDTLKQLFTRSNTLLNVLDAIFGKKASAYTSLTFQYGTQQPLHRDTPVFRTAPEERYVGVWFALENANLENGCLKALEGAHRGGYVDQYSYAESLVDNLDDISPGGEKLWTKYQELVTEKCKEEGFSEKQLVVNKGDIVIWHPQLPHGGSKILNPSKTRYSIVYHITPEDTPVYQADVFFNRNKINAPESWDSEYVEFEGRKFLKTMNPTIGNN
ncbi:phytanoyl-CoA dioxygenase family protein [Alteromonas macleodii]|uniref:phytanoyl-CoA dioxygenase family protein n=1 Tax=Alteromonas macleodii TaxID=28108 RepID=UPI00364B6AA2